MLLVGDIRPFLTILYCILSEDRTSFSLYILNYVFSAISSPTPEPTPGPTFSVNTTGPRCGWSGSWLSSHTPTTGPNGGEFETIAGLKSKYTLCSNIQKIKCRRVGGVPPPIGETRQIVCDPTNGFACKNKDQPSGRCYDYEVQVYCWDQMCMYLLFCISFKQMLRDNRFCQYTT